MDFFKKYIILFVIFITGASVLVIEVVAVRILSPYYGNTIFTVSSVIGIVLAALSFGYYTGGKLADKYPSLKLFYSIILFSGISVLFLQILKLLVLPALGYSLSIVSGPLVSAIILFFLPAFLLGMLSPFAIKLQKSRIPKEGIGTVAGKVFFWSTLGSIFGSLSAGFLLIPHFGLNQIVIAIGILLTAIGLISLLRIGIEKFMLQAILVVLLVFGLSFFYFSQQSNPNIVYTQDGVYEKITIYDSEYNGEATRFFVQDRSVSNAMFLDSEEIVFDYSKYYLLYKIFKPEIKETLAIGGGAYSIPKALLNESSDINVDVCEIEPSLFELGKKYFRVPDDSRLKSYVEDGRRFLHDIDKKYDLIFSDVYYSLYSIPPHFTTEEFFQLAKDKLSENGIFVANIAGSLLPEPPSFILSEIKTFKSVFPNSYFFAVKSPESRDAQNIMFVGCNGDKKIDFNSSQIKEHKEVFIRNLGEKIIDLNKFDFSQHPKLTDNFAPVEYLITKTLSQI